MSPANVNNLLKKLEQTLVGGTIEPDHVLLRRFLASRDQAAIQSVISRHGPMVYRVCRRVLQEEMDAEDAFQTTFLIFIRQAGSIRKIGSLASWLHGVAYQVALRIRSSSQRRQACEAKIADRTETVVGEDTSWREVRAILDEELARLPDALRAPIVLCYLEGLTQDEAAEQLGQPKRTLQRRLQRGRERLGIRLAQRGLPAVGMLTLFAESVVALPPSIESSTLALADAVLTGKSLSSLSQKLNTLTQEVIKNMFPNRLSLKWTIVLLFGLGLATAAIGSLLAEGQPSQDPSDLNVGVKEKEKDKLPADGIAWGETVDGLKAGISFRPGEEHSCREGGSATFIVYLRNEGKTPISISHNENVFDEFLPSVLDEDGKKVKVYPGPILLGEVSRVDRSLEAGETIRLGTAWFLVKPAYWRGTAIAPTLLAPRAMYKYLVSCAGFPLRRKGRDRDEMLWSTGSVELTLAYDPPHSSFTLQEPSSKSSEGKTVELFNGTNLKGWRESMPRLPDSQPTWQACGVHLDEKNPGQFIGGIVNSPDGKGAVITNIYPGENDLHSDTWFGSATIELEFMVARGARGGVWVMGEYEVVIRDSWMKNTPTDEVLVGEIAGKAPRENAARNIGEWQKLVIDFQAPRFDGDKKTQNAKFVKVTLNGKVIQENVEVAAPSKVRVSGKESRITGPLLLHCGTGHIAFRNIKFTPNSKQADSKPATQNQRDEIKVAVCGVLKREGGAFYIDPSGLASYPPIYIRLSEDKVSHRLLDTLVGKNVIVKGWVWQEKRSYQEGVWVYFIRFDPPKEPDWLEIVNVIPEKGDEALKRFGIKAEVHGVLQYQNPRVEGGAGYHVVLKSDKKNEPEVRVWLDFLDLKQMELAKKLVDKHVVVSGELKEETDKQSGTLPYQALSFRKCDIKEASDPPKPGNMTPDSDSTNPGKEMKEESEETFLQKAEEYVKRNEFRSAEVLLRKHLQSQPTGTRAMMARLLLGICIMEQGRTSPANQQDSAKTSKMRNEALQVLQNIVREVDSKQKEVTKLSETDSWVRLQAAIRILQIYQQTNKPDDLLREAKDLVEGCRGTVEELIISALVYHAFKQKMDTVKVLETRDKMKELFENLPASAFTSTIGEYSREYWQKTWFQPEK